ncbi:tetratricopeptide repeat protein [Nannocystis radixulma]|uniref:Tetratricopeptide repeat protein n=1 Tax=Nannocystis radixulma TaxID=2995305 RepID=A0ABT5BNM5_9BACT|nr:hypothetical protein [Nannocystis radixulma]MDC0675288.1 hypothetical protein [Nannocystis radixulma]
MSRSIHDTHGVLQQILASDYADLDAQSDLADEVRDNIRRQRRIKKRIQEQRGRDSRPPLPIVDPDTAPVLVEDGGPYVHHAATEADVREILRRMPPGWLDGLGPIRLCVGNERRATEDEPVDPWTGRPGSEVLPGVYGPDTAGLYDGDDASIWLHAFVHEPGAPGPFGVYLKLRALAVLVHELSHHYDYTFRTRGDRWRMDPGDKTEAYADARTFGLIESCVVPYLHERYGDECAAFRRWEMQHAGCSLPLEVLVDERPHRKWLGDAFLELVFALAAGEDPVDARAGYAESLALNRRHEDAQQVVDGVLGERPEHAGALALRAVAAFKRGDNDIAEQSCRGALASSPDADVAELLGGLLYSQARWQELADMTTHVLTELGHQGGDHPLLALRGRARVELLELDAAAEDVAELQRSVSWSMQHEAAVIDALRLCRGGRWEEALAAADRLLNTRGGIRRDQRAEAWALVIECALRLGRDDRVVRLDAAEVAELRSRGHHAWVDRLVAELRAWSARVSERPAASEQ